MKAQTFAYILFRIGFVGYLCSALLFQLGEQKITTYLLKQDSKAFGQIIPNRMSRLLFSLLPFIFFVMIVAGALIGLCVSSLWIILTIGIGVLIIYFLTHVPAVLTLGGNFLQIQRFGKTRTYQISDILSVSFQSSRGFIKKSLVIVFYDKKSYWFDMDQYCGIQNVYNELIAQLGEQF